MPMLAETNTSPPVPTRIGCSQASAMRSAIANASRLGLDLAQDDELVAAEARDGVRAAGHVEQARR